MKWLFASFFALSMSAFAQIPVTIPDISVGSGQRFEFSIDVPDLTGAGIESVEVEIQYDASVIVLDDVSQQGTLTESASMLFNADQPGILIVNVSSTRALMGAGTLLRISGSAISEGQSALTFAHLQFNEGQPVASPNNGSVTVTGLQSLVAHYNFDGNVADQSGHGHHGTLYGNYDYQPGVSGTALRFDNSAETYVEIPHHQDLDLNVFTLACWIRPEILNGFILARGKSYETNLMNYSMLLSGNRLAGFIEDANGTNSIVDSTANVVPGNWHFAVLSRDASGLLKLYLNGALETSLANTPPPPSIQHPLTIGLRTLGVGGRQHEFQGLIDEVRIYNEALTDAQVAGLYQSIQAPPGPTLLINNGQPRTAKSKVSLSLLGGASQNIEAFYVSESPTTPTSNEGGWVSITPSSVIELHQVPFQVSESLGQKTINAWLKFEDQSISPVISAQIEYINGSEWHDLARAWGLSSAQAFKLDRNGLPWLALQDEHLQVWHFSGSEWQQIGGNISPGRIDDYDLVLNNAGEPFVVYEDRNTRRVSARSWNGSSWLNVGDDIIGGEGDEFNLAMDEQGNIFLLYEDYSNDFKVSVVRYSNGQWSQVGPAGFSLFGIAGEYLIDLAIAPNGTPYVAYVEQDEQSEYALKVQSFSGGNWQELSLAGIADNSLSPSIAFDNTGNLYMAYGDGSQQWRASVARFNGSSWVTLGGVGISGEQSFYHSLGISPTNEPYFCYIDGNRNSDLTVRVLQNNQWRYVGQPKILNNLVQGTPSLAFNQVGAPFVLVGIPSTRLLTYDSLPPETLAPEFDFLEPNGQADVVENTFHIVWQDGGTGRDAQIDLYYDREGPDGIQAITIGVRENDSLDFYQWDISQVPNGDYRIFAVINDGEHPPQTVYSPGLVTVDNPQPVTFTTQPESQNLCSNQELSLSVAVEGTEPFTYQWRQNGNDIVGAISAQYSVAQASVADSGEYTCVVTNPLGMTVSQPAQVRIRTTPQMIHQPQQPIACVGGQTRIVVEAEGDDLAYQWFKDSIALSEATEATLVLSSTSETDAGIYWCQISNSCGSVTSDSVPLVIDQPITLLAQPQSQYVELEQAVILSVEAEGTQPLSYQWFFQGEAIPLATGSSLTLDPVVYDDYGYYYCEVRNLCGLVTSQVAYINEYQLSETYVADVGSSYFGNAIAMDQEVMVIGASGESVNDLTDAGAVYVYRKQAGSWQLEARLVSASPIASGRFGASLDLDGDQLVVGATGEGVVYAFHFVNQQWQQTGRISGGASIGFGNAVAISENLIVIGAPSYDSNRGRVYIYYYSNGSWTRTQFLTPSIDEGQRFGSALALEGTRLIVGSPFRRNSNGRTSGAVTNYTLSGTSFYTPVEVFPSEVNNNSLSFGSALDLSNDKLVVGAPIHYPNGKAYVFHLENDQWTEETVFDSFNTSTSRPIRFGTSVAIVGNRIAVGGTSDYGDRSHVALFDYTSAGWQRLLNLIPQISNFGQVVGLNQDQLAVGLSNPSNSLGSVYLYDFERPATSKCPKPWIASHPQTVHLAEGQSHTFSVEVVSQGTASYQWFHNSQPIVGANSSTYTVAVAAPDNQGVYHCLVTNPCDQVNSAAAALIVGNMTDQLPFEIPELEAGDQLGPMAISGNRILLGAPGDDDNGLGAVYIYVWDGNLWQREAKILSPGSADFGRVVALFGDRAAVQSSDDLYVFHYQNQQWVLRGTLDLPASSLRGGVSIFHDDLLAGDPTHDSSRGEVIAFQWRNGNWTKMDGLPRRDWNLTNQGFGGDVSISGDFATAGYSYAGNVFQFGKRKGRWQLESTMATPDFRTSTRYGSVTAIDGNRFAIGASRDHDVGSNNGAVYTYERTQEGFIWQEKLTPFGSYIGSYVDLSGPSLLIGYSGSSDGGAAYLYQESEGSWQERDYFTNPTPQSGDALGTKVAIQGDIALIGSTSVDGSGINSGEVNLFTLHDGETPDCLAGDVTRNGSVSAFDASQVLLHAVGLPTEYDPLDPCAADVTCNGSVSAFDAAQILRYVVALNTDLDCVEQRNPSNPLVSLEHQRHRHSDMPFKIPIQVDTEAVQSLEMQIVYDPSKLKLLSFADEAASSWLVSHNDQVGVIRVAAIQSGSHTSSFGFVLNLLPLQPGNAQLIVEPMVVNDRLLAGSGAQIDIQVSPCSETPLIERLNQWPQHSVRSIVEGLNCTQSVVLAGGAQ